MEAVKMPVRNGTFALKAEDVISFTIFWLQLFTCEASTQCSYLSALRFGLKETLWKSPAHAMTQGEDVFISLLFNLFLLIVPF